MASIFLGAEGVLLVDFLDTGHTISGVYNADLRQLLEKIKQIWCGKLKRGVFFRHDKIGLHVGKRKVKMSG